MVRIETTTDAPLDRTRSWSAGVASLDVSTANGKECEPGASPDGGAQPCGTSGSRSGPGSARGAWASSTAPAILATAARSR